MCVFMTHVNDARYCKYLSRKNNFQSFRNKLAQLLIHDFYL